MGEPSELVEQELKIIPEIQNLAEEQRELKVIRRQNNVAVRAWRLNIMRRVEKAQEDATGVFSEDEYKRLNALINSINEGLDDLGEVNMNSLNSVNEAVHKAEAIRTEMQRLYRDLDERINTQKLFFVFDELQKRVNANRSRFETVRAENTQIEKDNEEKRAYNKMQNEKMQQYENEAQAYINHVNSLIGETYDDGIFAWLDDELNICEGDIQAVAQNTANYLGENAETGWGTTNFQALDSLPNYIEDYLYDNLGRDLNWLHDESTIKQFVTEAIISALASADKPSKPQIEKEALEELIEYPNAKTQVEDLHISEIAPEQIRKKAKIPNDVIEELQSYRTGKYTNTIENAERINELAEKYNLLKLQVRKNTDKQSVREINSKIRELKAIQNSFGNERNSKTGNTKIEAFINATNAFLAHTHNQQKTFDRYYDEFNETAQCLKDWINRSWWQFGGQPENHHKGGKNDSSEITRVKSKSGSDYSGPTL